MMKSVTRFTRTSRVPRPSASFLGRCGSLVFGLVLLAGGSPAMGALVAHWTGNGTADDATANNHDGTATGGVTFVSGKAGQAFKFDGSTAFVSIPGNAAIQPTDISIAMWIKAPAVASSSTLRLVADSSHGTGQKGWALQLREKDKVGFVYGDGSTFPEAVSTLAIADDSFHHLAATLDGTNLKIYIDGVLDTGATLMYTGTPMAQTDNSGNIRLGRHHSLGRQFNGLLDDVRVYDHALDKDEVSALASIPEPSSLMLAAVGLLSLGVTRRRRRRSITR